MECGRKIYYNLLTGNVIVNTGESFGDVVQTTIQDDFIVYKELSERNIETVGILELEYGQYAEDFVQCNGYKVNIDTGQLEFSYPDPSDPVAPPVYQAPLTQQVKTLEDKLASTNLKVKSMQQALDFMLFQQAPLI